MFIVLWLCAGEVQHEKECCSADEAVQWLNMLRDAGLSGWCLKRSETGEWVPCLPYNASSVTSGPGSHA